MLDSMLDVEVFDLLAAARTPQVRSQLMENLCELIMRKVSFLMFQRIRCKTQILSCVNGVVSHDAALSSFPDIVLAGIVDLAPLDARAIIAVEGDLIGAVVDEACGATSSDMFVREELSVMEIRFGKQMIDITIEAIAEVLSNLVALKGSVTQYETSRGMLSIDEAQAWMISTTGIFESTLGFGSIKLIIPYAALESLETKITSRGTLIASDKVDSVWMKTLDRMVDETPVEVRVEIARARVSIDVLDNLREGQVLPVTLLPYAVGVVGESDMFLADYGQSDGYVCCRLKGAPGHESADGTPDPHKPVAENRRHQLERIQTLPQTSLSRRKGGILKSITTALTVELGRVDLSVATLRQLQEGNIVPLNQTIDEPLGIFANGRRFGYGEVISLGRNQYGIRFMHLADDFDALDAIAA